MTRRSGDNAGWGHVLGEGPVVVLSPHVDDAALSLGASVATATRLGSEVRVVSVLAGDPASKAPAGWFDAACGFATAGDAARVRREEDLRACTILGATPYWLPYADEQYGRGADDLSIWSAIAATLEGARTLLLPGFPLEHADHLWVARLALAHAPVELRLGLYVEQPYAAKLLLSRRPSTGRPLVNALQLALRSSSARRRQESELRLDRLALDRAPAWQPVPASLRDVRAKLQAIAAYPSQVRVITRALLRLRIGLYEWSWGGEGLAWLER